jgi:hypothetical protein
VESCFTLGLNVLIILIKKESIPVTGCEDVEAPTFHLDSRLTDGGKVVSLTRRSPFNPQQDSWYSFLLDAESTLGP